VQTWKLDGLVTGIGPPGLNYSNGSVRNLFTGSRSGENSVTFYDVWKPRRFCAINEFVA